MRARIKRCKNKSTLAQSDRESVDIFGADKLQAVDNGNWKKHYCKFVCETAGVAEFFTQSLSIVQNVSFASREHVLKGNNQRKIGGRNREIHPELSRRAKSQKPNVHWALAR
jgi:hypothetical protein